jgi:hypothetical protein
LRLRCGIFAFPTVFRFGNTENVPGNLFSRTPNLIEGLARFLVRSKWSCLVIGLAFPLFWVASLICARYATSFLVEVSRKDNWIQNAQVVVLVVAIVVNGFLVRKLYRENLKQWAILYALFGLVLCFVVGEEKAWGQRIFNIPSPDWFMLHNKQHQMTVHNLWAVQPALKAVRIGVPLLLVALSILYAALGKRRIEMWRGYLWLPHPMLLPLWLCYASYNAVRPIYMALHPEQAHAPDVISKLAQPGELIVYSGILFFVSLALTHDGSVELASERQ